MFERLRIPWAWTAVVVVFIIAQTACVTRVAYATKMHYVHWNTSNPIFRIDNTDHIIDVNKGNVPFEYDQVNIICPVYTENRDEDVEKYIIYNVSKEEYDTCRITNPSPRIIAVCDKPYKLMYFTITFRSFTPQPGGLEFKPGQDYYFISTSSRHDLHRRIGGRCTTHNMKVVFKVCCDPASQPPRDQANGISTSLDDSSTSTSTAKSSSSPTTPKSSPTTSTTSSTTTVQSTTSLKTTSYKSTGTRTKNSGPKTAGTKKEARPKPHDAVKKELTLSGGRSLAQCHSRYFGVPLRAWVLSCLALLSLRYSYML